MNTNSNSILMRNVVSEVAPYALAKDESIADFVNTLLRGTNLESLIKTIQSNKSQM